MTIPTGSYQKVFYDLRPAKQVERRMIIDALQELAAKGFAIRDYQYTGLGSIYFVDFVLFHRLLGMRRLLSVEYDLRITKRIQFNRPYENIELAMKPIGDVIHTLDQGRRHLLWLDYDSQLEQSMLTDVSAAAFRLSPGSIVLITVDLKPPAGREAPRDCMEYYQEESSTYFDVGWTPDHFSPTQLASSVSTILLNAIRQGLSGRTGIEFSQLFRFTYADGHPMLTLGGMLVTDAESSLLARCNFGDMPFIRRSEGAPGYDIVVPRLTRKERIHLDGHMPCKDGWAPEEFELEEADTRNYRDIYRYYPWYGELLL